VENTFKVVIVGGGSAGWMTAAYLRKALEHGVDICLVESDHVSTIGVGEATFSTIQLFLQFLDLQEKDWMRECQATYKMAIKFVGWNAEQRHFYHPFQRFEALRGRSVIEWWLKCGRDRLPFDYACFSVPAMCDAQRSPRYMDGRVFDHTVSSYMSSPAEDKALVLDDLAIQYPYAYHFDASLFAKYLSRYAIPRGVRHIVDHVLETHLDERGYIRSIQTAQHGEIEGDLFVDCTGFRGMLINKALGEPFISFSDALLCDSAVAMQVPSDGAAEGINPYTTATALSAGWVWNIPLFHRVGTGYVYSSAFLSPDAAEHEFRAHLGRRATGTTANHIKMRIGRCRNSWVKNCVAIGLSSGFVEPLESTGLFFIQHGIEQLVNHFPRAPRDEALVRHYNMLIGTCIDGVRDFLTMHYVGSTRADTGFWKATKSDIVVPPGLAERLSLWKECLPTNRTISQHYHGFEAYSYCCMLLGLGYTPTSNLPALDYMNPAGAREKFDGIGARARRLTAALPSQYEYLAAQYGVHAAVEAADA
jgi:tryptophan 6-halogenase